MKPTMWEYQTLKHHGRCRIDGEVIRLRFLLELTTPVDVLEVEAFVALVAKTASTVEGYTKLIAEKFGGRVTGRGQTRTHGRITCTFGELKEMPT